MSLYRLTPGALADLQSIARYLRKQASDLVAAKVVERILSTCDELSMLPALGHRRPALTSKPVMFHSVGVTSSYSLAMAMWLRFMRFFMVLRTFQRYSESVFN